MISNARLSDHGSHGCSDAHNSRLPVLMDKGAPRRLRENLAPLRKAVTDSGAAAGGGWPRMEMQNVRDIIDRPRWTWVSSESGFWRIVYDNIVETRSGRCASAQSRDIRR